VIFSLNIIKTSKSSRNEAQKKKREKNYWKKEIKKEEKEKLQSSNKREDNILRGEKHFNFKNILFDVISFSPLPSDHFKNPFQNH
jgi:hypothetical protein